MTRADDAPPESGPRAVQSEPLGPAATVRLDPNVIARIDAIAEARSTARRKVTRAAVLRELIALGLPASERQEAHPLVVHRPGAGWTLHLRRRRDD